VTHLHDVDLSTARAALELDGAPQPGDHALVERLVSGALQSPAAPTMWTRAILLATAAVVVIGGAAGAARMLSHPKLAETPVDTTVAPQHVVELSPVTTMTTAAFAPPAVAASPDVKQPAVAPAVVMAAPAPVTAPSLTADELFKKANDTRRHGDARAAVGLYRDLQTTFPSSPEAKLSHLTAGRLYLDALSSPSEALPQFDACLAGGDSSLREDALIGRATALERLGRRDDERKAWRTLLSDYPQSVAADHAKSRSMP